MTAERDAWGVPRTKSTRLPQTQYSVSLEPDVLVQPVAEW